MTIERRIERLEKIHPTKSMSEIDEWLLEGAEPYENDEERKEITLFNIPDIVIFRLTITF